MHRPIGVMLLAGLSGLAGLAQIYAALVYLGIAKFDFVGNEMSFQDPQWGAALWTLLIAAIWLWVAMGFWNLRLYAVQFGIFIALFTLIWGFFALLFGSTYEAQTIPWLLAGAVFLYLSYPGVQQPFIDNEKSKLTPAQVEAMDNMAKANAEAGAAPAPGMATPEAATPTKEAASTTKKDDASS
jgi:hypothetical protein